MELSPIVTQPQCYSTTRSFEWQSELCDCGDDCNICLCGTFCYCCLGCIVAKDMDECCSCGHSVAMRTRYRSLYRIPRGCDREAVVKGREFTISFMHSKLGLANDPCETNPERQT